LIKENILIIFYFFVERLCFCNKKEEKVCLVQFFCWFCVDFYSLISARKETVSLPKIR